MKTTAFWIHHVFSNPVSDPDYSSPKSTGEKVKSILQQVRARLAQWMCESDEPRVWTTRRSMGTCIWHVYDPISNTRYRFDSESETRTWLEKRYYLL
jgi:hypothetical protein